MKNKLEMRIPDYKDFSDDDDADGRNKQNKLQHKNGRKDYEIGSQSINQSFDSKTIKGAGRGDLVSKLFDISARNVGIAAKNVIAQTQKVTNPERVEKNCNFKPLNKYSEEENEILLVDHNKLTKQTGTNAKKHYHSQPNNNTRNVNADDDSLRKSQSKCEKTVKSKFENSKIPQETKNQNAKNAKTFTVTSHTTAANLQIPVDPTHTMQMETGLSWLNSLNSVSNMPNVQQQQFPIPPVMVPPQLINIQQPWMNMMPPTVNLLPPYINMPNTINYLPPLMDILPQFNYPQYPILQTPQTINNLAASKDQIQGRDEKEQAKILDMSTDKSEVPANKWAMPSVNNSMVPAIVESLNYPKLNQNLLGDKAEESKASHNVSFNNQNGQKTKKELKCVSPFRMLVVHGNIKFNPCTYFNELDFKSIMKQKVIDAGLNNAFGMQSYAWPALYKNGTIIAINNATSGKTWSYIPVICSRILNADMTSLIGPKIVVLVASTERGIKVYNTCSKLVQNNKRVLSHFDYMDDSSASIDLMNGCGIFITTPELFLRLMNRDLQNDNSKKLIFDNRSIIQFVIDDLHKMHEQSKSLLKQTLLKVSNICGIKENSKSSTQVPLFITSSIWIPSYMIFLLKNSTKKSLIIGDCLEAFIYAQSSFNIEMYSSKTTDERPQIVKIRNLIKKNGYDNSKGQTTQRAIIICNDVTQFDVIKNALPNNSYLTYDNEKLENKSDLEDLNAWGANKMSDKPILICTDKALAHINDFSVNLLISYDAPATWSKFKIRFFVFLKLIQDFVKIDFDNSKLTDIKREAVIFIDVHNNDSLLQLPRIKTFFEQHNNRLPEILEKHVNLSKNNSESKKMNLPICPMILTNGLCALEIKCKYRHYIFPTDYISNNVYNGNADVEFIVVKVYTPLHMAVRLLRYKTADGPWINIEDINAYGAYESEMVLYFSNKRNKRTLWPIKVGDICFHKTKNGYNRVCVIDIPEHTEKDKMKMFNVRVKLMDTGTHDITVGSLYLMEAPERFKKLPSLKDIRLVGMTPKNVEGIWPIPPEQLIKKYLSLEDDSEKLLHENRVHVQGAIDFSIADTIFLKNMAIVEFVPSLKKYVQRQTIFKFLKMHNLIKEDDRVRKRLIDMMPLHFKKDSNLKDTSDDLDIDIKMAYNDNDHDDIICHIATTSGNSIDVHVVSDTKASNVDIAEFSKLPIKNLKTKSKAINIPKLSTEVGTTNDNAASLKWCPLPLHQMIKVKFGNEKNNGRWNNIYVQRSSDEDIEMFEKLNAFIATYVGSLRQASYKVNSADIKIGMYCIIKYDSHYLRARIQSQLLGSSRPIYEILFLDYGCVLDVMLAGLLHPDCFYPITKDIMDIIPFQTIHCTLMGIELVNNVNLKHQAMKKHLYAYAMNKNEETKAGNLNMFNSYSVLLYETDDKNHFVNSSLINDELVKCGLAKYVDSTRKIYKHHQKLVVGKNHYHNDKNEDVHAIDDCMEIINNFSQLKLGMDMRATPCKSPRSERPSTPSTLTTTSTTSENTTLASTSTEGSKEIEVISYELSASSNDSTKQEFAGKLYIPKINRKYKYPKIKWDQEMNRINLAIVAPDVNNYKLQWNDDEMVYISTERQECFIVHFYQSIDANSVRHSRPGNEIKITMLKLVSCVWPHLTKRREDSIVPWMKYNLDSLQESGFLANSEQLLLDILTSNPYNMLDDSSEDEEISDNGSVESLEEIPLDDV